ncbi:hypothetical protein AB5I41_09360 [Sphingomonas sp. MMS24-JH45]
MMARIGSRAVAAGLAAMLSTAAVPGVAQPDRLRRPPTLMPMSASSPVNATALRARRRRLPHPRPRASGSQPHRARRASRRRPLRRRCAHAPRPPRRCLRRGPVAPPRRVAPRRSARAPTCRSRSNINSDRLTDDAKARARVFATALMTPELRGKRFRIEGHTNSRGARRAEPGFVASPR